MNIEGKDLKTNKTQTVCKTMFLHTSGHSSDAMVTDFLKNPEFQCITDKRGLKRCGKMEEISEENYKNIKAHIESYHPVVHETCSISVYKMWEDLRRKYHMTFRDLSKVVSPKLVVFYIKLMFVH
ncbi:hypothetical protein HHI36_006595 [Cryptolaemus montrouzieri]|uniref:Uncharacterized protein n=1 Tax=Cryptolaemus montrouzieri TaxID=559131 RepID=A0ABD2NXV5_9CUCU